MLFLLECTVIEPNGRSYESEGMEYSILSESAFTVLQDAFQALKNEGSNVSIVGDTIVDTFDHPKYAATYVYRFSGRMLFECKCGSYVPTDGVNAHERYCD